MLSESHIKVPTTLKVTPIQCILCKSLEDIVVEPKMRLQSEKKHILQRKVLQL